MSPQAPLTDTTPSTPAPSSQQGRVSRRAVLALAGLGAAGAGALLAWRHASREAPATPTPPTQADAASAVSATASAASAPLLTGDQLGPAFWQQQFDRPQGAPLSLASAQGQPVLINFWATWCPPCVKEMPELDRFHREFGAKGWRVIGLAIDGPTPVREFLAKVAVGFDIGLAGFGGTELAQALGNEAGGLPFSVLIDAQGRVRHRKMGATHYQELADWARQMA